MTEGKAFQFAPWGIVEGLGLVEEPTGETGQVHGAVVSDTPVARRVQQPAQRQQPPTAIRPRDVLKLARTRVRDIKLELRRMKTLQLELAQLEQLLSAAKTKPKLLKLIGAK